MRHRVEFFCERKDGLVAGHGDTLDSRTWDLHGERSQRKLGDNMMVQNSTKTQPQHSTATSVLVTPA